MKRVVLIGAAGFVGGHVLSMLKQQDVDIYAIQNKTPLPDEGIHVISGGIRALTKGFIDSIQPDIIYHCARPVMPRLRRTGRRIAAFQASSLNKYLLKQLKASRSRPFMVFASGSLMYGNADLPHDEDSSLNPISYARQYYRGELPLLKVVEEGSYPIGVLRLPWLLGEGSWFKWFIMENARKHNAIPGFGDMQNLMEIIDITDAAKLMICYAEAKMNGIYNIYNQPISQKEFLITVSERFNVPIQDYTRLFPGGLEKESIEAFTSNITLISKHKSILQAYKFRTLQESIDKIG
jgi:nucleoside-diphosphate-sugar epimerase